MGKLNATPEEKEEGHRLISNFLNGIATFPVLLQIAKDKNCWIEVLVIQTGMIDALLRMALVLREQLDRGNAEIEFEYLYQADGERNHNERAIYRLSFEHRVLSQAQLDILEGLYKLRNKAIHRLFISEIRYGELTPVSVELDKAIHECTEILRVIEDEQIKTGVGMTKAGKGTPFSIEDAKAMILKRL